MASGFRLFFATDLHGSEVCFRKFVAAAKFYNASVLFLGGDLSGKALLPIWRGNNGSFRSRWNGEIIELASKDEQRCFCRLQADRGIYTITISEKDYLALSEQARLDMFEEAVAERLSAWVDFATDRLKGTGVQILLIPGNDDSRTIDPILEASEVVVNLDSRVVQFENFQALGLGCSTPTPWNTPREASEEQIMRELETLVSQTDEKLPTICNIHVPPFSSGLDLCPKVDGDLRPVMGSGGVIMEPVGSRAVREIISSFQPILGLFGHVHEARGATKLGRTLCFNPGSNYFQGSLLGVVAFLQDGELRNWQLTEG